MPADPLPAPPARNEVPPAETPGISALLTLAMGAAIVSALHFGREIFIPIVLAVLLSFVLAPIVDFLRGIRFGRAPSVMIAVALALSIILGLAGLIGTQIAQLASDLPLYQTTITQKVSAIQSVTIGRASELLKRFGREINKAANETAPPQPTAAPQTPEEAQPPLPVQIREPELTPVQLLRSYIGPILDPFAKMGIMLVVVIFILMQREDLRDRMIRLFGSRDLHRTTIAMNDAARRLSRYFLTQLGLNAGFGVLIGIGLWLIGVPSPVLWGIVTALMRFVPYIGAFISGALPLTLAAAVDPGWSMAVWTLTLFLVAEPIMGHVIEPLVYGHSTGLSPFAVVVSAIFWTWLWGPIGLLLATPLTVCLVVLGRHVERLEFLDVLLGDRPALSPMESFYQRMLAGDPDEAQEHAEQLLKQRSLSSYYDEVALKGLQLAANDAKRGVLTQAQLDQIKEAIKDLVADLAEHDDVDPQPAQQDASPAPPPQAERDLPKQPAVTGDAPPPDELPAEWRGDNAILCIAGRGLLDEAASEMLAQLLRKHGLGAGVVPHEAVSRSRIGRLDTSGVAMVCISYLEISGNPAHLRYLIRRLRQKLPKAPILVGLWPAEDEVLRNEVLRSAIGADYYVTFLREAVACCLEAAREAREAKGGMNAGSPVAETDQALARVERAAAASPA